LWLRRSLREACASQDAKLLADAAFVKAAAPIFEAPMKDPLYDACSGALLYTFATCPQVKQVTASADRLLQLRIYNSYTIERNDKKSAMFESGGEIGISARAACRRVLQPGVAGDRLPNVTYMLGLTTRMRRTRRGSFSAGTGLAEAQGRPSVQGHGEQDHQHRAQAVQGLAAVGLQISRDSGTAVC
jgi:hypothetical protein